MKIDHYQQYYEQPNLWGNKLEGAELERVEEIISLIPKDVKTILEVGCGDGFATYYFDKEIDLVEGGDISENMISNNPVDKDRLKIIDAEDLNLPDESYDLVYTWEVLHHVQDPQKAVKEMARVAKKYVVIFEPNNMNILQIGFALLNKEERGTLRSSKNFLENLCENSNLKSEGIISVSPAKRHIFELNINPSV